MIEKRNIVETGRTPQGTEKAAEVVDEGVALFGAAAKPGQTEKPRSTTATPLKQEEVDNADGKTVD